MMMMINDDEKKYFFGLGSTPQGFYSPKPEGMGVVPRV